MSQISPLTTAFALSDTKEDKETCVQECADCMTCYDFLRTVGQSRAKDEGGKLTNQ